MQSNLAICLVPLLLLGAGAARAQSDADPVPETFFYEHDGLRLQAYLFRPQGSGPFPLVVYNHGSAVPGEERVEWTAPFIARVLVPEGFAVLVPERRGYGKSDGKVFSEDIGDERGSRFVERLKAEASDVLAAVDHVTRDEKSRVDKGRIALLGHSFGGIVTTFAAGGTSRFAAVIVTAPGALNWDRSAPLREAMTEAARRIQVPLHCAVAENDATTESARAVCDAAKAGGATTELKIYPPFTPTRPLRGGRTTALGHALFSPMGVSIWQKDAVAFLTKYLKPPAR